MTIVREWSGHVPADQADGFHEHLLRTGIAEAQATEGFVDSILLRRADGDRIRFTLLTQWVDMEAVRRYAGKDADAARVFPGDERFGLVPDRTVTHRQALRSRALAPIRRLYLQAARTAAALLRDPVVAAWWERPSALERYAVSGLAGHLAGQVFFAERALAGPEPDGEPIGILDYYDRVAWMRTGHNDEEHVRIRRGSEQVAADGVAALAARVEAAVERLPLVLFEEPALRCVGLPSWQWSLTYDDFLLSRLVELPVHVDDLAVSVNLPSPQPAADAAGLVLDLLWRLAARKHGPAALLRALSRAERAPASIAVI
jgi:hypothetical protein